MIELYKEFRKKIPGLKGIGRGLKLKDGKPTGEVGPIFNIEKKKPRESLAKGEIVPERIDGVKTDVVQVGIPRIFEFSKRVRPFPLGSSIGNPRITAGTSGCFVQRDSIPYLLSNYHVLAGSNDAVIGEDIIQPGAYDGGIVGADTIGQLAQFVPIKFITDMLSDCSISTGIVSFLNSLARKVGSKVEFRAYAGEPALPINYADCALCKVLPEVYSLIGNPVEIGSLSLSESIYKIGRTTERTEGIHEQEDLTIQVAYDSTGTLIAIMTGQAASTSLRSAPGDSGSAIQAVNQTLKGLLFAGSNEAGSEITIYTPIQAVFEQLGGGFTTASVR